MAGEKRLSWVSGRRGRDGMMRRLGTQEGGGEWGYGHRGGEGGLPQASGVGRGAATRVREEGVVARVEERPGFWGGFL